MSIIELLKYIFLGLIQGFTKVLPISSSGHVAIIKEVLNLEINSTVFLSIVNFGSLIAVLIYFRKSIIDLIKDFFLYLLKIDRSESAKNNFNYSLMLVIATIPFAIVGILLRSFLNTYFDRYLLIIVGIGSLVGATFLYLVKDSANKNVKQKLSYSDAFIIGVLQIFSAIPGLSRFAITTSTGMLRKNSMDTSLKFSIFLYIPISVGIILGYSIDWIANPGAFNLGFDVVYWYHYLYYFAAFAMSIIATLLAIKWVFIWFRKGKFIGFAVYSMVVGFIALVLGLMIY